MSKNRENFKSSKPRVNLTGSFKEKECTVILITISAWCQSSVEWFQEITINTAT